jgi:hypothetical protein
MTVPLGRLLLASLASTPIVDARAWRRLGGDLEAIDTIGAKVRARVDPWPCARRAFGETVVT